MARLILAALLLTASCKAAPQKPVELSFCGAATRPGAFAGGEVQVRAIYTEVPSPHDGSYLAAPDRNAEKCNRIIRIQQENDASKALQDVTQKANDANRSGVSAMVPEVDAIGTLGVDADGAAHIDIHRIAAARLVSARARNLLSWELLIPDGIPAHPKRAKE